jgi:hypothetical protein
MVSAVGIGTSQITATSEGVSGSAAVTVTAAPPPPPPGSGPRTDIAYKYDTFDGYSSDADFKSNYGPGNTYSTNWMWQYLSIDQSVLYNGHKTLKSNFPSNSSSLGNITVDVPGFSNMWYRVKLRFSPGFTTRGSLTASANSLKLLAWGWTSGDGRGDLEITNTTEYQLHWNVPGNPFGDASAGSVSQEWTDGGWYDYIINFEKTSGGARTRFWFARDGSTPVLKATVNGSGSALSVGSVSVPHYFNQNRTAAEAIWIGQWEIIDGSKNPNPFGLP